MMVRLPVFIVLLVSSLLAVQPLAAAPTDPGGTFFDDDRNTHEANIEAVAAAAITLGCDPAGTVYCPSQAVTRAQMATFLSRALDLPNTTTDYFTDDTGNTHEANINKVAEAGISLGCGGSNYCPTDHLNRAQMATFLARALELASLDASPRPQTTNGVQLALFELTADCDDVLNCPAQVSVPAGNEFFALEGWNLENWSISSELDRLAFEDPGTRTGLRLNGGDPLRSQETFEVDAMDTARKRYSFQFPSTLTGTHELEVSWYQTDTLSFRVIVELVITP